MLVAHMLHQCCVATPPIPHAERSGERHPTAPQRRQALIAHGPRPVQFVPAGSPRADGVRSPNGTIHWHHHWPVANDHDKP